jgi:hypothetical protein
VDRGALGQTVEGKRSMGFAHHFRPRYAGANLGHPSGFVWFLWFCWSSEAVVGAAGVGGLKCFRLEGR